MQSSIADSDVSNPEPELSAFDEWRNDTIAFPTITDTLLARLAFSKDVDTFTMGSFLSLVQDPRFNPRECALHNLAEIHSYAHDTRKARVEQNNAAQKKACSIPSFVWEEVILRIGSQWVDFVSETYKDHEGFDDEGPKITFRPNYITNQDVLDLRAASVVHRSWTSLAQRQLGRVLILHDLSDAELISALRSPLYGSWTQVIGIKGSRRKTIKPWTGGKHLEDLLSPSLPLLRTLLARLPCLTSLYFETAVPTHPLALLSALKTARALRTISISFDDDDLNDATKELVSMLPHWTALKRVSLVGFVWDTIVMDTLSGPDISLSHFTISGGGRSLDSEAIVQRIRLAKRPEGSFGPPEVWMERGDRGDDLMFGVGFFENGATGTINVEAIQNDNHLTWLSNVTVLHVRSIRQSEAEQIFKILTGVEHLSWSGEFFVPSFQLPSSIQILQLSLKVVDEYYDWHTRDRTLRSFLLTESNADLKELRLSVHIEAREDCRGSFSETERDFMDIYLPRASKICKQEGILLTLLISFDANGQPILLSPSSRRSQTDSIFELSA